MDELISHPGPQFYILQLDGALHYDFGLPGKPAESFRLSDMDFEGLTPQKPSGAERYTASTSASAVGLEIRLVRNDGTFTLQYEGKVGSDAWWTFEGLQETEERPMIYASACTQTCITTFVVKSVPRAPMPLIDAKSEEFLRSKGAKITSVSCRASNGDVWNVSAGGVAKRLRGEWYSPLHGGLTELMQ